MLTFKVKEENLHNPQIGFYTAYGIEVYTDDGKNLLTFISDLFTKSAKAEDFADLCNRYQPELVHLEELCQDFIQ